VLSTPHLFIGGALGALLGHPTAAMGAGVVSHHLADCILHTDTGTLRKARDETADTPRYSLAETAIAVSDLVAGLVLLHATVRRHPRRGSILAGALAGIAPDLIDNSPGLAPRFRATGFGERYHAMHHRLHRTAEPHEWPFGVVTQVAAILIGAALLRR
jgi:hypothetical protein